jgi:hypothetical protein
LRKFKKVVVLTTFSKAKTGHDGTVMECGQNVGYIYTKENGRIKLKIEGQKETNKNGGNKEESSNQAVPSVA